MVGLHEDILGLQGLFEHLVGGAGGHDALPAGLLQQTHESLPSLGQIIVRVQQIETLCSINALQKQAGFLVRLK